LIKGNITRNVDGLWVSIRSIRVANLIQVPRDHPQDVVDSVSEYQEILHQRLSRHLYSQGFHRPTNKSSDPVIALKGAAERIMANVDGLFRMDGLEQRGETNWLHGVELLRREINRLTELFIASNWRSVILKVRESVPLKMFQVNPRCLCIDIEQKSDLFIG
jgi:hypothetical protein